MSRTLKGSLLLCVFALCGLAFVVGHALQERRSPPQPHALFAVVHEQLSAFRTANYHSAYRQAATGVQQKFTPAQFERMVRRKYAEIARAQRVEFGLVQVEGDHAVVQVFFFAADGSVRAFLYSLTNENGAWKIDGVEEGTTSPNADRLAGIHA